MGIDPYSGFVFLSFLQLDRSGIDAFVGLNLCGEIVPGKT